MPTIHVPIIQERSDPSDSSQSLALSLEPGSSTIFVGPNGTGKTRLAVLVESQIAQQNIRLVRRVAAQRSIALSDKPALLTYDEAFKVFHLGNPGWDEGNALQLRYRNTDAAIKPQTDFDSVLQALYAEQAQAGVKFNQQALSGGTSEPPVPKLARLRQLWRNVLPHRDIEIGHGTIRVKALGGVQSADYEASKMSDGERVIFYMLGQALLAEQNAVLVIDEPELHIHKSILSDLWDQIESARPDLALVYVTHDLEFAASRSSATIFGIEEFDASRPAWKIACVDTEDDLPDSITLRILGARQDILFVEGEADAEFFRAVYAEMNVIPAGNCEQVIYCTRVFNANPALHHKHCFGLIDRDGRSDDQVEYLASTGVYTLPVTEIENLLLLPSIWTKILEQRQFSSAELTEKVNLAKQTVLEKANANSEPFSIRHVKRVLDQNLKSMGLSETRSRENLKDEWERVQTSIDIDEMFRKAESDLDSAIQTSDLNAVLKIYDDKSMLNDVATTSFGQRAKSFKEEFFRFLRADENASEQMRVTIRSELPDFPSR